MTIDTELLWMLYIGIPSIALSMIFKRPIEQAFRWGGSYQAPDDSLESAWRFLWYLVALGGSLIFALIAQLPTKMYGFEVVIATFGIILVWQTRVDMLSGSAVPFFTLLPTRRLHLMEHGWTKQYEPFQFWFAIVINLAVGFILVFLGLFGLSSLFFPNG